MENEISDGNSTFSELEEDIEDEHQIGLISEPRLNYPAEDRHPELLVKARKDFIAALSRPLTFKSNVVEAVWEEAAKLARVTRHSGNHLNSVGRSFAMTFYLLPEEALFLLESRALKIYLDDTLLTAEMLFRLALDGGEESVAKYFVYYDLKRLGYIVTRAELGFHGLPRETIAALGVQPRTSKDFALLGLARDGTPLPVEEKSLPEEVRQEPDIDNDKSRLYHEAASQGISPLIPHFHVYRPNSKFSKNKAGEPDFKVYVALAREENMSLRAAISDEMKIAVVDCGLINYLSLRHHAYESV